MVGIALICLGAFYLSYMAKLLMLRRRHIQVDLLGKGVKPRDEAILEMALKCVTYLGAAVQFISVIWSRSGAPSLPAVIGLALMALGAAVFILAIAAMRDNWRAGYSEGQNTHLVTEGIYRYSRNPAFLGFDLLYIGGALAYPNPVNIAVTIAATALFHLQILGEEKFLDGTFGSAYRAYRAKTMRYFGTRKGSR